MSITDKDGKEWVVHEYYDSEKITKEEYNKLKDILYDESPRHIKVSE